MCSFTAILYAYKKIWTYLKLSSQTYISQGASIEASSRGGLTPLMLASENGDLPAVKVRTYSVSNPFKDFMKASPLLPADMQPPKDSLPKTGVRLVLIFMWQALLACEPNIEASTPRGLTSLMLASEKGHLSTVQVRTCYGTFTISYHLQACCPSTPVPKLFVFRKSWFLHMCLAGAACSWGQYWSITSRMHIFVYCCQQWTFKCSGGKTLHRMYSVAHCCSEKLLLLLRIYPGNFPILKLQEMFLCWCGRSLSAMGRTLKYETVLD